MCLKGKVGRLFKDEELHWFLASVGILTFLITLALVFQNHYDWELAFRKALLHPNAVLPVRINKQTVSSSIVTTVLIFFAFYLVLILIGWTALLFLGVGFSESVSTVISSIGNVGPGLGTCGPAYSWNSLPDLAKWILSFLMLVGRLELFSVLLLFYPGFWKNR